MPAIIFTANTVATFTTITITSTSILFFISAPHIFEDAYLKHEI